MYTDIFKYVKGNEDTVRKMAAKEAFLSLHREVMKCRKDEDPKGYRTLKNREHYALMNAIDLREKYRRHYFEKPVESVLS